MLAFTPATVSSEDSVGLGASPPRLVSHTPTQFAIRSVRTSAVGSVAAAAGAGAGGPGARARKLTTLRLPAVRCIASTCSAVVISCRVTCGAASGVVTTGAGAAVGSAVSFTGPCSQIAPARGEGS